jgi:uncharacterized protein
VKIAERCNINCTYCYMFNKGWDAAKVHPPYMGAATITHMANFLAEGARDVEADTVAIDFHGGEPLMMKKQRFDAMCIEIKARVSPVCKVQLRLQTNAILVDEEWIALFEKHDVRVGVSLDGPPAINDRDRVGPKGEGTHAQTLAGLRMLQRANLDGRIASVGLLSVASPHVDGSTIYDHFVNELDVDGYNILLPDDTYENRPKTDESDALAKHLCDAFDAWAASPAPRPQIKRFRNAIRFFNIGKQFATGRKESHASGHVILVVSSDGELHPNDTLRETSSELFQRHNVATTRLVDYLVSPEICALESAETTLPTGCRDCAWKNMCVGGAAAGGMVNRYSTKNGFNNPSVHCSALQQFYSHIAASLLRNGLSYDTLQDSLIYDEIWGEYSTPCPFSAGNVLAGKINHTTIPIMMSSETT